MGKLIYAVTLGVSSELQMCPMSFSVWLLKMGSRFGPVFLGSQG